MEEIDRSENFCSSGIAEGSSPCGLGCIQAAPSNSCIRRKSSTKLQSVLTRMLILLLAVSVRGQLTCTGFSNVNTTAPLIWQGECVCVDGYIWNTSPNGCVQCSTLSGAANTGSVQGSCACTGTKIWRGSSLTCIATTLIDCTVSPNNGVDNTQAVKTCLCIAGYTWSNYFRRCQYTCTGILYYKVGYKPSGQSSCPCITNTNWNPTSLLCGVNCASITSADTPEISPT